MISLRTLKTVSEQLPNLLFCNGQISGSLKRGLWFLDPCRNSEIIRTLYLKCWIFEYSFTPTRQLLAPDPSSCFGRCLTTKFGGVSNLKEGSPQISYPFPFQENMAKYFIPLVPFPKIFHTAYFGPGSFLKKISNPFRIFQQISHPWIFCNIFTPLLSEIVFFFMEVMVFSYPWIFTPFC